MSPFLKIVLGLVALFIIGFIIYKFVVMNRGDEHTNTYAEWAVVPAGGELVKALYGGMSGTEPYYVDVTAIVRENFTSDGKITSFTVNNDNLGGDPIPGATKRLKLVKRSAPSA